MSSHHETEDFRHKDYFKLPVKDGCVIIVGQNPGNQYKKRTHSDYCWVNNKSANFLQDCLTDVNNIVLTNVCQYKTFNKHTLEEGLYDLQVMADYLQPSKIICLGEIAYKHVSKMYIDLRLPPTIGILGVKKIEHPSFILRFNKDQQKYRYTLRSLCV